MKFKGENLEIRNVDWNHVRENAYYILQCDAESRFDFYQRDYGSVAQIHYIGNNWLEEIHESWFECADKGSAGCWIANENGIIIAQMAYYGKGEGYVIATAHSTGDHWLGE